MSHELETIDGIGSYLGKDSAWHKLGQVVGDSFDRATIQERAPWILSDVEKIRPHYLTPHGIQEGKTVGLVRTYDGKLVGEGHGADSYGIVQSSEILEMAEAIAKATDFPIVSAGTLREGTQVFFTLYAGEDSPADFHMRNYVTACTSHDGSLAAQVFGSNIVTVCANTLAASLFSAFRPIRIRHTRYAGDRVQDAIRVLEMQRWAQARVNAGVESLARIRVTDLDLSRLLDRVAPVPEEEGRSRTMAENMRGKILGLYRTDKRVEPFAGTALGFVQAVNTYENWNGIVRGKGANVRAERQFGSMLNGQPLTAKALAAAGSLS